MTECEQGEKGKKGQAGWCTRSILEEDDNQCPIDYGPKRSFVWHCAALGVSDYRMTRGT